ncbi:MAG: ABC transporter permease [Dehalococcoidia bacterium]|nr:ABC transporter permease [Dehalococcoidia bacterium]
MRRWLSELLIVFSIEFRRFVTEWPVYLLVSVIAAAPLFLVRLATDVTAADDTRLLAGAVVFGLGLQSINGTGQLMVSERFEGQMKLFRTAPMSQGAYVVGITLFTVAMAAVSTAAVLGIGALTGIAFSLSLLLIPLVIMTGASLTGFAVLIATNARTASSGALLANTLGVLVALLSPVFYPIERLPEVLQLVAHLSPFTYAGQAFTEVLSGGSSVLLPSLILLGFMLVTTTLGIVKMRWRES